MTATIKTGPFQAIFLVGGTGTGRRTAAKILTETSAMRPIVLDAFHFEVRERCHAAFKLFDQQRLPAQANYFEETIDEPNALFGGLTPRVAYSKFTQFVHKAMGLNAPGKWVVERLQFYRKLQSEKLRNGAIPLDRRVNAVALFDDAPVYSYEQVVTYIGADNCTQLVIQRDGIASMPVDLPGVRTIEVKNPGDSVAAFESAIRRAAPHLFIQIATSL